MINFTDLQIEIIYLKNQGELPNNEIADRLNCNAGYVGRVWKIYTDSQNIKNDEAGEYNISIAKLFKQKQKMQDQQRYERKIRNTVRLENTITEYTKSLIEVVKNQSLNIKIKKHPQINTKISAIFQLSDLHLNELISIPDNKFDFNVAAKRLRKYVIESMRIFDAYKITDIVIAMTGDIINSDRRLDELLNMSTNRSRATILAVLLIEQVIVELASKYNIKMVSISGNESRVQDEFGSSEIMMSYNYDYNVFEILKLIFRNSEIEFIDANPTEQVINVNGRNILLIHGNQLKGEQTQSVQKIIGKYSMHKIKIDYVIFGHLHETRIGEYYARSSSLCGSNAYSDSDLQLISRASQNIHIIEPDSIHTMKIDLQNTKGFVGYNIVKKLEAYNAKSHDKIKRYRIPKI